MQGLQSVAQDLGLVRIAPGSLGLTFVISLVGGITIAAMLGWWTAPPLESSILLLGSLLVWQPLVEELLFRGVLQGFLLTTPFKSWRWQHVSAANLITALAFCSIHLVSHSPLWALATIFPALLFGYFREASRSLFPALILHSAFNAAYFIPGIFQA